MLDSFKYKFYSVCRKIATPPQIFKATTPLTMLAMAG